MKTPVLSIGLLCLALEMVSAIPTSLEPRQKAPGVGDVNAQCTKEYDCCFTSEAACFRQYGYFPGQVYCPFFKWCATEYKIPRSKCNADCCSISTGIGRGCPGK